MEFFVPLGPVEGAIITDDYLFEEVKEKECYASVAHEICDYLMKKSEAENIKYLCVCVPCYNEDLSELIKTFVSLLENFEFMERKARMHDDFAGKSLKNEFRRTRAVIVPIFDGVKPMSASMREWLTYNFPQSFDEMEGSSGTGKVDVRIQCAKWWYYCDDNNAPAEVEEQDAGDISRTHSPDDIIIDRLANVHRTGNLDGSLRLSFGAQSGFTTISENFRPENLLFFHLVPIIKRMNHRKHNSHQWFFDSICQGLDRACSYAFLTDCGTTYTPTCLGRLYYELYLREDLIGVTARQRVEIPNIYYHPCEDSPFSFLRGSHQAPQQPALSAPSPQPDDSAAQAADPASQATAPARQSAGRDSLPSQKPCWKCWATYILSPAPLQGFEFEATLIMNSAMFNLIEALPVMPGPCQLLDWQKMKQFRVVQDYFHLLFQGEGQRKVPRLPRKLKSMSMRLSAQSGSGSLCIPSPPMSPASPTPEQRSTIRNHIAAGANSQSDSSGGGSYSTHTTSSSSGSASFAVAGEGLTVETSAVLPLPTQGGASASASASDSSPQHARTPPPPPLSSPPNRSPHSSDPSNQAIRRSPHSPTSPTASKGFRSFEGGVRHSSPSNVSATNPSIHRPPSPPPAPEKFTFAEFLRVNMRLAEDRILSFVSVFSTGYGTKWIPGATFYYQPEIHWQSLLTQRRRWLNGTFASFLYFFNSQRARVRITGGLFDSHKAGKNIRLVNFFWSLQLVQLALVLIAPAVFGSAMYIGLRDCARVWPEGFSWALVRPLPNLVPDIKIVDLWTTGYLLQYITWCFQSFYAPRGLMNEVQCRMYAITGFMYIFPVYFAVWYNMCTQGVDLIEGLVLASLFLPVFIALAQSFTSACLYLAYLPWFLFLIVFFLVFIPAYAFSRLWDTTWGNRSTGKDSAIDDSVEQRMKQRTWWFLVLLATTNVLLTWAFIFLFRVSYVCVLAFMFVVFSPMIVQLVCSIIFLFVVVPLRNLTARPGENSRSGSGVDRKTVDWVATPSMSSSGEPSPAHSTESMSFTPKLAMQCVPDVRVGAEGQTVAVGSYEARHRMPFGSNADLRGDHPSHRAESALRSREAVHNPMLAPSAAGSAEESKHYEEMEHSHSSTEGRSVSFRV